MKIFALNNNHHSYTKLKTKTSQPKFQKENYPTYFSKDEIAFKALKKSQLKSIDKFVVVSKNTKHEVAEKVARIMQKRLKLQTSVCYTEPDYVYDIKTGKRLMEGLAVTAMCAIGQPQQFYDFLKDYQVVNTVTFDDHHQYSAGDIVGISGSIITTEKDAVKLARFDRGNIYALRLKTVLDVKGLLS